MMIICNTKMIEREVLLKICNCSQDHFNKHSSNSKMLNNIIFHMEELRKLILIYHQMSSNRVLLDKVEEVVYTLILEILLIEILSIKCQTY
jgi:hypothetical protein